MHFIMKFDGVSINRQQLKPPALGVSIFADHGSIDYGDFRFWILGHFSSKLEGSLNSKNAYWLTVNEWMTSVAYMKWPWYNKSNNTTKEFDSSIK